MDNKFKKLIPFVSIFFINLVSAYSYYGWGYSSSPLDYLDNEWVRFTTLFLVIFALVYFSVTKAFKDNQAVAAVIALGVTLLITVAISQQGLLYTYAGDQFGNWITLVAILLALGFFIKISGENFGASGVIVAVIISLVIFNMTISLDEFSLAYAFQDYNFQWMWESIFTVQGFVILGILVVVLIIFSKRKDNDFGIGPFKVSYKR